MITDSWNIKIAIYNPFLIKIKILTLLPFFLWGIFCEEWQPWFTWHVSWIRNAALVLLHIYHKWSLLFINMEIFPYKFILLLDFHGVNNVFPISKAKHYVSLLWNKDWSIKIQEHKYPLYIWSTISYFTDNRNMYIQELFLLAVSAPIMTKH